MAKTRSQRLMKKLHLGEFTELGFDVTFQLKKAPKEDEVEHFLEVFLAQAIEKNGLVYGGGFGQAFDGFVALEKRGSVTEEQRLAVKAWLEANTEVSHVEVGELTNAWY
ncbi:MAG TPA: 50S ribosome-binding protein YggL [Methylophilus sp.]